MKIDQLRNVLDRFADLHAGNGAKAKAGALRDLSAALNGHDNKTVKAYVKKSKTLLANAVRVAD